jgi:hypothetical protein
MISMFRNESMMKKHYLAFLALLVASSWALGDGIGFKGDRVESCTTTVINLTREQQVILDAKPKKKSKSALRSISLTPKQRLLLQKEAGFAPEKLDVWPLAAAKNTCTCELLNMAIRFKSDMMEVPHFLLGKDIGDRLKSKQDREKEKNSEIAAQLLLTAQAR